MEAYLDILEKQINVWIFILVIMAVVICVLLWVTVRAWREDGDYMKSIRKKIKSKVKHKVLCNPSLSAETLEKELYEKSKKKRKDRATRDFKWTCTVCLAIFVTVVCLGTCLGFVDICLDYNDRSFVVYYGEYEYINNKQDDTVILDNGKKVFSTFYKADGIYMGYVIYSRRSEIVVSFDEPIDEIKKSTVKAVDFF